MPQAQQKEKSYACFDCNGTFLESGAGWVMGDEYWHYDEKIPTIVQFTYVTIMTLVLGIIFLKDLWWLKDGI